jgi:hypothetical protein
VPTQVDNGLAFSKKIVIYKWAILFCKVRKKSFVSLPSWCRCFERQLTIYQDKKEQRSSLLLEVVSEVGHLHGTQRNDTQQYDIHHNDNRLNDTQGNNTHRDDVQHNDFQGINTQHNDIQHIDFQIYNTQHNAI